MKKQKLSAALLAAAAGMTFAMIGHAQSVDSLLDKLVDKGVLSVKEANDLREESDKDFTKAYAAKNGMPEWVTSLKFNGDLRMRYDRITAEDLAFTTRDRFRYRLRFGYTAVLKDDWEVGIGLTSTEQIGKDASAAKTASGSDEETGREVGVTDSRQVVFMPQAYITLQETEMRPLDETPTSAPTAS